MRQLTRTLRFIASHPLNRRRPLSALLRYGRWQMVGRLAYGPMMVPFADGTTLMCCPGMEAATANLYCGLHEFEEMAFAAHLLRGGEPFFDVGANIGAYSILVAAHAHAQVTAFEPVPATYRILRTNVAVNGLEDRINALAMGVAEQPGRLRFTVDVDSGNHVLLEGQPHAAVADVQVTTIDSQAQSACPRLIKLDVEGFEQPALAGAKACLENDQLWAVIIELNGSGTAYGYSDQAIEQTLLDHDFLPVAYDPLKRTLRQRPTQPGKETNVIYVRDLQRAAGRLESAQPIAVLDQQI